MKALSIRQPWADLILGGYKDIENRTWRTSYRGRFIIHSPRTLDEAMVGSLRFREMIAEDLGLESHLDYSPATGAFLGTAVLLGCTRHSDSSWFHGPWGFEIANPSRFPEPIPGPGALGFFDPPEHILEAATTGDDHHAGRN